MKGINRGGMGRERGKDKEKWGSGEEERERV